MGVFNIKGLERQTNLKRMARSVVVSIYKQGDKELCSKYRGYHYLGMLIKFF